MNDTLYNQLLDLADKWDTPSGRRGDDYMEGFDDGKSIAARDLRTKLYEIQEDADELHA